MRTGTPYLAAAVALVLLGGAGCFNDAFRGHEVNGEAGINRFELLIEPDRTLVDGTHFLVDRATGDVWRLEPGGRTKGTWVRLADGPTDVSEIDLSFAKEQEKAP